MKTIAISACLLGKNCRYNGEIKEDKALLSLLEDAKLIPFCPEDFCYGTPRPSMDLRQGERLDAYSNATGANLAPPLRAYAEAFFHTYSEIDLLIGKDRSPSCGVGSAKCYDEAKNLLSQEADGVMIQEAKAKGITTIGAEAFKCNA
jgi:uncharacterized protein YbbK (DUF523 family)